MTHTTGKREKGEITQYTELKMNKGREEIGDGCTTETCDHVLTNS